MSYILNPNKTEQLHYTDALNCTLDPHDAYLQMKAVYEMYSGHSFDEPKPEKGNGRVKAIHYIQSFSPDDNVPPETAHNIAKAFVIKTFGKEVQAVIATHINTKCVHNHIIINSYSISGQKFYANKDSSKRARKYSDAVSRAFGIEPSPNFKGGGKYIYNAEYQHIKRGTSWKEKIRNEIDTLLSCVNSLEELLTKLERLGYTIKQGKYISVKAADQMRLVRLKTLGEKYTEESLRARIFFREVDADNDLDIHRLSSQLSVINQDRISSIGDLKGRISKLKKEYEKSPSEELKNKLIVYSDIRDTYYEISKGDYISNLAEEERKRKEQEQSKKKPKRKR